MTWGMWKMAVAVSMFVFVGCSREVGLMNSSSSMSATAIANTPTEAQARGAFDGWKSWRASAAKPTGGNLITELLPGGVRLSWSRDIVGFSQVYIFYQALEGGGRDWSTRSAVVDLSAGYWVDVAASRPGHYGYAIFIQNEFWMGEVVVGGEDSFPLRWDEGKEYWYFPSLTLREQVLASGKIMIRVKTSGFNLADATIEVYAGPDKGYPRWTDIRLLIPKVMVTVVSRDTVTIIDLTKYDFKAGERMYLVLRSPIGQVPKNQTSSITFELVSSGHQAQVFFRGSVYHRYYWQYYD